MPGRDQFQATLIEQFTTARDCKGFEHWGIIEVTGGHIRLIRWDGAALDMQHMDNNTIEWKYEAEDGFKTGNTIRMTVEMLLASAVKTDWMWPEVWKVLAGLNQYQPMRTPTRLEMLMEGP